MPVFLLLWGVASVRGVLCADATGVRPGCPATPTFPSLSPSTGYPALIQTGCDMRRDCRRQLRTCRTTSPKGWSPCD